MSQGTNAGLLMTGDKKELPRASARQRWIGAGAWVFVVAVLGYYAWRMVGIGLDLRQDVWVYCANNHAPNDMNSALDMGRIVLGEAENVAREQEREKTPAQRKQEAAQIAAGQGPATISDPGPGLFDSPINAQIFFQRWHRLSPVYGQILRGWVRTYDHLLQNQGTNSDADYGLDYPPLRLMVMTLWTWDVQSHYPGITAFPVTPQRVFDPDTHQPIIATDAIVQPMLKFNALCEGVSSISIFILVWLWMERRPKTARSRLASWLLWPRRGPEHSLMGNSWRARWGDPLLLVPVIVFGICTLLRSSISWQMPMPDAAQMSLIDVRVSSIGWWVSLLLRFLAVVCLARFLPRPFRAPMCALVAATMAWLNPGSLLDSFGWPQWDVWLPPFFLVAAILVTLDWWIAAGLLLGVGCMFKGQLLFVSPVLVLCPLLAGWPGRFLRIVAGMAAGAGLIVWPWLVTNRAAERWILVAMLAAGAFCAASGLRGVLRGQLGELAQAGRDWCNKFAEKWPPAIIIILPWIAAAVLGTLVCFALALILRYWTPPLGVVLGMGIVVVPWFLPRRLTSGWLLLVFAAVLWLVAFQAGGAWSWYRIGFVYGTQRHQMMQLDRLSNLSSLLGGRYQWQLRDHIATLKLPIFGTLNLDVQGFCGLIYFASAMLCAAAAAMHMRRRDVRFLIALAAPWVLFTTLLTQLSVRYTTLPAVMSCSLIAISAEMSLLAFLQTVLTCIILGNQMMLLHPSTSPVALSITQPMNPDIAWAMMLLAAIFLVSALIPTRRAAPRIEVV
ncbi:MAG TPA: hypothetical protein VHX86_08495 [Tepidisphaeraceae bacterium]|jgi:hypothetical protein|nr:hypothetical protein [Tepidisphaeraceae bacterium]